MLARIRSSLTARLLPAALLLALAGLPSARADAPADPPGRVARVGYAVGSVSLQPAGSESWVSDVLNRPLTTGDKLWSDQESRVEMHIGSAAVRLGSETGVEVLNIDDRTVQLKLSAGTLALRVRALGTEQTFEIATPTAAVSVLRAGEYRIEVGDSSQPMRIAVAQGQLAVTDQTHESTLQSGQLAEYSGSSVEDATIGGLPPGDAFDQWVAERDRREDRAASTQYVSREVTGYEDLDEYGSWRTVDEYGPVWVPAVSVGWAPYRYGHWGWIAPWGWTWIDEAPWGFAPFHYGRWVSIGGSWCWAPGPRRYAPVYAPALVGWVGGGHWGVGVSIGGPPVGWFPLGWNEVYVPSYAVSNNYVRNVNVTNIHVTNTVINNYITNNTTINNGVVERRGNGDQGLAHQRFANLAVAGAVTATTRSAFTSAQPVASHLAKVPHEGLESAPAGTAAPPISPTAGSLGRRAAVAPHAAPELWARPVVARTPPPPPPPSFEAQRHAVAANHGVPVPLSRVPAAVAHPAEGARPDVIHVGPPVARPVVPAAGAARPGPQRSEPYVRPPESRPAGTQAPAAPRPPVTSRPSAEPRPQPPADARGTPEYRPAPARQAPPSPPRESRAAQPAPDYRPPPAREPTPPREATPQAPREYRPPQPAPEYRPPPTPPREAAPQAPREYRPPQPAQEYRPPPAREPAPPREAAPQAPREYRPPQPAPEYRPPQPAPEYRPPPAREAPPPPREAPRSPPPAQHSDKPAKPEPRDPHDRP